METITGRCRFCSQEMSVIAENQAKADQMVENQCGCIGVTNERKKESMAKELDRILGAGAEKAGFSPVEKAVADAIETVGFMAIEGMLQGASFKVDGTAITIKVGEKIKVSRKYTYEQSGEIE